MIVIIGPLLLFFLLFRGWVESLAATKQFTYRNSAPGMQEPRHPMVAGPQTIDIVTKMRIA
jgi:hypothetical protein